MLVSHSPISFALAEAVSAVSSWGKDDLVPPLLLLVLGIVLGIGVMFLAIVAQAAGQQPHSTQRARPAGPFGGHYGRARPAAPWVSSPDRWLAVRSASPRLVQAALGLSRMMPCSWEEGLIEAQDQKLFVSPSLRGWVLVVGTALPDPAEDVDRCFRFLHALSQKVGRVQFFSLNRALHHHAWVQANHGKIVRAFAWAGQTLWNQGTLTTEERQLRVHCPDYLESGGELDFADYELAGQNTDKVPLLAARWSLDPAAVDPRWTRPYHGMTGEWPECVRY